MQARLFIVDVPQPGPGLVIKQREPPRAENKRLKVTSKRTSSKRIHEINRLAQHGTGKWEKLLATLGKLGR